MFGGFDGESIMRGTWRLDLHNLSWRVLPFPFPKPVYFHSSAITEEGKVYSFGGVSDVEKNTRTNQVKYFVGLSCYVQYRTKKLN
jgi:hypothetical protein